ncbi:glycosyltransferase family 2 protein [Patescibacteria group bacterium]|nr:glycosyltransferase family 2 protein [Patescibacteria group bacterium]
MKAVVIVPTYNERDNIILLLNGILDALTPVRSHAVSILVVDDTSPDKTADVVRSYQKKHKNVFLLLGKKEGLGRALLRGMAYGRETMGAELFIQMDADLSHDPKVLPEFLEAIDRGADFVVGSRYIPGGSIPENWAVHRKIYSIIGNTIVRFGLGYSYVHDWTGGFRAYRHTYYDRLKSDLVRFSGYLFQIAFLHRSIMLGARVVEVPIHFTDRRFGHSKIAPSQYIRDVFHYVLRERMKSTFRSSFFRFCVVGTIGFIINTVVLEGFVRIGLHPVIGGMTGAELAIISNFILNNAWTFSERRIVGRRMIGKFIQFNTASIGAVIIQGGTIAAGTAMYGISSYRLFYLLGVGLGLIWNYTLYSRVIWKKH